MAEFVPFRLGVLGSGGGSNFGAIVESCQNGALSTVQASVAVVLSDVEKALILERARDVEVNCTHIAPGNFRTKLDDAAEAAYIKALNDVEVDLVVLAGFMRVLKGEFLRAFEGRVVNVHPSLLPAFPGLEAWKQALDHGVKVTGATVHFVDQGVDSGAIIAQKSVPVLDDDTPGTLHKRIHGAEHRIYPEAIAAIARGEIALRGRGTIKVAR
ncbi:MAG: phosphoribosylglycinamide formyltransferase [Verrucomicrobia subdivision 3 bacterium]|nr:phosphoribosylglycinamide formyltransferase [Limisphaerales bacterium]